ncbi:MAG: FAD-binding protein, partial [Halobacteriovoraceae bacterium]|nr:FAD-binding protein [Halobacteriovoraceae bacterium]
MESEEFECIIIGAGAAGLMCAAEVGKRGKSVALLEHNETAGKKILISGGGRCNFTNLYTSPKDYVGSERHFHKYALAEYTPKDFVSLVESYKISYFEKESGQLFCAGSAKEILNMLLSECRSGEVALRYKEKEIEVVRDGDFFLVNSQKNRYRSRNLVVATGGLALTSIGASPFGHQIGQKF